MGAIIMLLYRHRCARVHGVLLHEPIRDCFQLHYGLFEPVLGHVRQVLSLAACSATISGGMV